MKYAAIFILVLCLFVGAVSAADLSTTQGQGQAILSHVGGANITFTNIHTGTTVSSNIIIDGGVMTPTYVGPSVMSTSWGTGPNQTASDVYITHTMGTNGTLKGKIVEKTLHSFSFQLTTPNGEQIVSFPDGSYRIVNNMSDTMDGITIPAPWGIDANGTYIPMHYSQHFLNPTQLDLIFDNTTPIVPPVTIDPTWVATNGFWTSISGSTTTIMCNTSGTVTFTMPSGLFSNTINGIVIVGGGGTGGTGGNAVQNVNTQGGLGGGGGTNGSINIQPSYSASAGTQYTLTVGSSASTSSAFGYTATPGSTGSTGANNAAGGYNGGNGNTGSAGYSGYSPLPSGSTGSNGGYYGNTPGSGGAGGVGFGAGGGGGGGAANYVGSGNTWYGGLGGPGASGYITFTYQNTGSSTIPTPVTQFLLNATGGTAPVSISFTDKTANASGWSYSYTAYVNGVYSSGPTVFASTQNPTYTFGTAGVNTEYQIMETAENVSSGKFNTSVQNTWVNTTSLNAAFGTNETNPNLINGVLPVQLSDTSGASQNMWNFGDQNPNYLNILNILLLHGNLTPFIDSSQYATTVATAGNATIGQGIFGGNAIYIDGLIGDYISVPSANFNFGSGPFSFQAMVNPSSYNETILNGGNWSWSVINNTLVFTSTNTTATTTISGGSVPAGKWTQVSITKTSSAITEYINAVSVNTLAIGAGYTFPASSSNIIIAGQAAGGAYLGQYSNNLSAALNFNSSTLTVDDTGYSTWTNSGAVQNTTVFPNIINIVSSAFFGTAQTAYIYGNGNSHLAFGTNPFTVVYYFITTANTTEQIQLDWEPQSGSSGQYPAFFLADGSTPYLIFYSYALGPVITGSTVVTNNVEHQVALTRNASNYDTLYLDGIAQGSPYHDTTNYLVGTNRPTNGRGVVQGTYGPIGNMGPVYIWNGVAIPISQIYPLTQTVGSSTGTFTPNSAGSIDDLAVWNVTIPVSLQTQELGFGGIPAQFPLGSGNPVTHTYTTPNVGYTVTDTAWDQYGGYSQATGTIPVYVGVPYASFTESPTSGQASLLVTFTDTSYRGTASGLSYNWSFGDSSGTNPYSNTIGNTTHVYAYNGVFYPNLTITNANGTSYYVGQPITLSNTQTQTYYLPTQVQLKFTDYNGAPLTGVSVVATPINFSAPAGWINTLLGINPNVNIVGTSVGLNTDTLGVCAMPMVQSIEYSIAVKGTSALNPAETVNTTFNLFPVQTAYEIPLPTNLVPYALPTPQTATTNITYSITNTTGVSTQTYTTTYNDATGGTTALQLFVENTTGAWIASSNYTGSAANSETFSQSEPNPNGGTYTWGFLATQSQLGNITQTQTVNFPEFINLMGAPGGWPT